MESRYKHHHEIKSLPLIISDTLDQKRMLAQKLYAFDSLSYEKGSLKDDYLIREQIKNIQDDFNQYQGVIGLFDYGKSGDLKAYEDILIYFVKHFIDKFDLAEKLKSLNCTIITIEQKNEERPLKYAGRDIGRKNSLYIVELNKRLKSFELQLHDNFKQSLLKFMNNVNHILFFEKIILCVNNIGLRDHSSRNVFNLDYLPYCIINFIWFNHKINAQQCSDITLKEFLLKTFHDIEAEYVWVSRAGNEKRNLNDIIDKILFDIGDQLRQMEEIQCTENELSQSKSVGSKSNQSILMERVKLITRLKSLLSSLTKMNACEEFSLFAEDQLVMGTTGNEDEKYLFHVHGSFSVSLKTIGNLMTNVLVFVYSWMLRELYHQNLPYNLIDYLNRNLTYSEDFIKFYCTAVNTALLKDNQKKLLLRRGVAQYIPMDLAKKIIDTMNKVYDLLNGALISTYRGASLTPDEKRKKILLKKMVIINDHLNSIWKMIIDGLLLFPKEGIPPQD